MVVSVNLARPARRGRRNADVIAHVIPRLTPGGAEMMLLKLLSESSSIRASSVVIALDGGGRVAEAIQRLGVPVFALGVGSARNGAGGMLRLRKLIRSLRPALLQGWLAHGNLAALAASAATGIPCVWNVRQTLSTLDDPARTKRMTALLTRAGALLSRWPRRIIYNSRSGLRDHEALGYRRARSVLIPNGFDTDLFRPDPDARESVRAELGVPSSAVLVGLIARYHPSKDHETFLRAAQLVRRERPDVRFLLAGSGADPGNRALAALVDALGLARAVELLGDRADTPRLMASLDLLVSSSCEEAFSNSIGEAMASGVPCVVTDVGDSAWLVGEDGVVVPARDPGALASAATRILALARQERSALGAHARERIVSEFSIQRIARQYEDLYARCLATATAGAGVLDTGVASRAVLSPPRGAATEPLPPME